jgi:transcriptional regulator with XRE-family HTH domain
MDIGFGNRLKGIREEKGIKREDIADKVGTSPAIIGRYERGERTPSVDIARKIAAALGVSLDYLAGGDASPVKDKKMLYRLEELQKVGGEHRDRILYMLDVMLRDAQAQSLQEKLS